MDGVEELAPREQRAAKQSLRFVLIGRDHGRLCFHGVRQRLAIGIEQSFHAARFRHLDNLAIKVGRNAGLYAAADHQPAGLGEAGLHQTPDLFQLRLIERVAHLV